MSIIVFFPSSFSLFLTRSNPLSLTCNYSIQPNSTINPYVLRVSTHMREHERIQDKTTQQPMMTVNAFVL